jgi:DNA-binding transcriptional regulator YiaG
MRGKKRQQPHRGSCYNKRGEEMSKNFLAENIATIRWWAKMSQKELGAKLCVPPATISNWERGICDPPANKLLEIAQLLNKITIEEMLTTDLQKKFVE